MMTAKQEDEIEFYFEEIDAWLCAEEGTENFDTNFFESLHEQWTAKGHLSEKQIAGLENIYNSWVNV